MVTKKSAATSATTQTKKSATTENNITKPVAPKTQKIPKRASTNYISVYDIKMPEGYNRRSTREKRELLKAQILAEGKVKTPITGWYDQAGNFNLNHGWGRTETTLELLAEGATVDSKLPVDIIPAPVTDGDHAKLLMGQLIDNDAENLLPLDAARIYREMIDKYNWDVHQIAASRGVTAADVGQKLKMLELPEEIQESIDNEEIAATVALGVLQTHGKEDAAGIITEMIEDAKKTTPAGKKSKATKKNYNNVTGKSGGSGGSGKSSKTPKEYTSREKLVMRILEESTVTKVTGKTNEICLHISQVDYDKLCEMFDI